MGRSEAGPADLDAGWPDGLTDLDVVWASTSLHHVADPPARLAEVRTALAPGGGLVLVEIDDVGRFQPGLLAVVGADLAEAMRYHGGDWGRALADAGSPPTTYSRSACNRPRPSRPRSAGSPSASVSDPVACTTARHPLRHAATMALADSDQWRSKNTDG
jgi:SAM-dependent methyltransferase